ncbi:hypothetical protein LSTR_LSTR010411 [Laodelphax striatellus]|uniref:FHA domain-containing protein n=1 Tax=Laodelphax striatellus TaxID=195883 RepID=A0A482XI35_LAOST|nr:hypothetical protein LSTR_LSTR010411 [Laodelphax striatellus]
MDSKDPQQSTSSQQAPSASKRSLPDAEDAESQSKRMKTSETPVNVDESRPEEEVKKLTLEKMLAILCAEGHLLRGPPPKRRKVIGILLPPIECKKKPILIKGSVSIGRSPSCDIVLTKYGTCSNISDHHATITYDRSTGIFELLNYSKTFTVVDNLGYSNSAYPNSQPGPLSQIDEYIANRRTATSEEIDEMLNELYVNDECRVRHGKVYRHCAYQRYLKLCFPGCAILKHGSALRFGCIEFIFCSLHQM